MSPIDAKTPAPLAIYIHWPYCARICPYCDFNVYKARDDAALVSSICQDLSHWRELSGAREVISVHFGGGTPSLMSAEDIETILSQIDQLWGIGQTVEIGLEANPNTATQKKLTGFHMAGINRLSLGVQSFHNPALEFLGRDHNAKECVTAIESALGLFPSVSLDLIYGWRGQTAAILDDDLGQALSFGVPHISAYQLTIEEQTAFGQALTRGENKAVTGDQSADFYDRVDTQLSEAGYEHYEVSNYAKPTHRSRHNQAYWQGHDYVGVGPGAHGRLTLNNTRHAMITAAHPKDYIDAVQKNGTAITTHDPMSAEDWRDEYVIMGLRIADGISLRRLAHIYPDDALLNRAEGFISDGYLKYEQDQLCATPKGWRLLNHITDKLLIPSFIVKS